MNARQQSILQVVIDKGRMSVADLAKMTGVSEVTIRQDLNLLEKQSYLRRTHGYAVPLDSEDVETRMMTHFAIKRELASRAAALVNAGETVFIENGSSNALLARTLAERGDIDVYKRQALLTLSYLGAERAIPNYNVMGLAKASLEANVRYMANAMGPEGVRVNAISAGPIRTLAASGIKDFRKMLAHCEAVTPIRRTVT